MGVAAGLHLDVEGELRCIGERPEELLGQLVLEAAGRARGQLRLKEG